MSKSVRTADLVLAGAFALSALIAIFIAARFPIEPALPAYLDVATELRDRQPFDQFAPLGYPLFLSLRLFPSVETGLRIVHLGAYLCLLWLCWVYARKALKEVSADDSQLRLAALFGIAGFVCFNPYWLIGLIRVSENGAMIFILAGAFLLFARAGPLGLALVLPIVLAVAVLIRPNAVSLLPLVFVFLYLRRGRPWAFGAAGAIFVLAYAALSLASASKLWFWPANGGYNLFAGNNPFSLQALQLKNNAETSLEPALRWCGIDKSPFAVGDSDFSKCTAAFVSQHVADTVVLAAYKAYNLMLRPNLVLADSWPKIVIQYLIVVPAALWWLSVACFASFRRSPAVRIAIVFIAVYAAPFLLTNSDPRFRIPFDAVYALSAFLYLAQPRHSRIAAASGRVSKRLSPANAGAAQASRSAARPSGAAAKASGA